MDGKHFFPKKCYETPPQQSEPFDGTATFPAAYQKVAAHSKE